MNVLDLPRTPRKADLKAFVVSFGLLLAALTGSGASVAGAQRPMVWAFACATGVTVIGLTTNAFARWLYARWDRLASLVSRFVRLWLTVVTFVVVTVVGMGGTRLPWRIPVSSQSGWRERDTLDARAYNSQGWNALNGPANLSWIRALGKWGVHGNGWVWSLLPFLVLIGWLDRGEVHAPTDRNYTLY